VPPDSVRGGEHIYHGGWRMLAGTHAWSVTGSVVSMKDEGNG